MKTFRDDLDFSRTWSNMPPSFEKRVQYALRRTEEEKPVKKPIFRTVAIVIALLTIATAACAAAISKTVDIYGLMFHDQYREKLEAGELAVSGAQYQIGDVIYTLDDAVFASDGLYAAGVIKPADGAKVVLIPQDYEVTDPAGYLVYFGDEEIPQDAPTYRDLAEASGATLVRIWARFANDVDVNNAELDGSSGSECLPQQDGSVIFASDFSPANATMDDLRGGECQFKLLLKYCELTLDGDPIEETDHWEEWVVNIVPQG